MVEEGGGTKELVDSKLVGSGAVVEKDVMELENKLDDALLLEVLLSTII